MPSFLRIKDKLFYGWVVVVASFFVGTTIIGIRLSFGVFFKSIESEFNLTRTVTSAVVSTNMILAGVFALLGGWAIDRYGPRIVVFLMGLFTGLSLLLTSQTTALWQLFITYSLLLSIGTSATYVMIMTTVSRWFDKKRGLALGIASAGAGLGTVVMAPFATYLISNFDWRMAYLVVGLIAWLIVIPLSRLLRKDPYEIGALPDGVILQSQDIAGEKTSLWAAGLSLSQAFKTRTFWFFIFIFLLSAFCLLLVFTHLVPHVTDLGFSAGGAAAVLSLMSGVSIAGRVLVGTVSDRIGRKRSVIICSLLQVGAMVWLIWAQELWMLYLFAFAYGFAYGGRAAVMGGLVGDTFGVGKMGAILGVLEFGWAMGAAIGPAMGGLIFDVSNSYSVAFLVGAAAMLIVALLTALLRQETNRSFLEGLVKQVPLDYHL
ncbi:L-lactate transporter [subsurface metagenome]